jgi:hypothetical protein
MAENIVHIAFENLKKQTGIKGFFTTDNNNASDFKLVLEFKTGKELFDVMVKQEIRFHQLENIIHWANAYKNPMLIANTIFPRIKEELRKYGIAYMDTAGNIFVQTNKNHIWIEGNKKEKVETEKANRAFTATGLKAVCLFLIDAILLNQPQRIIAQEAKIALGNINYIIKGLKEYGFLIEKGKNQFQLINKKELLEKWLDNFEEKLKPALHIGNFKFTNIEEERNWKHLELLNKQTFWGGEPAGAIITNYLVPEIFTLYTEETRNNLIKNYRLVPDPLGKIKVYKKFWKNQAAFNDTVVHPLLAYTDLMNTGNSRCVEIAKIIYDKYINAKL